jgi:hypothetical protein
MGHIQYRWFGTPLQPFFHVELQALEEHFCVIVVFLFFYCYNTQCYHFATICLPIFQLHHLEDCPCPLDIPSFHFYDWPTLLSWHYCFIHKVFAHLCIPYCKGPNHSMSKPLLSSCNISNITSRVIFTFCLLTITLICISFTLLIPLRKSCTRHFLTGA